MLSVSATQTVEASREELFAFLDRPMNQARVSPSVTGVADVRPKADGGKRLLYGYSTLGIVFTGSLETVEYEPPQRITFRMDGDVVGEIRWELEALGADKTRFTYAADYDLSGIPGAGLLRPLVRWLNEAELRRTVRNVARLVENGDTVRGDFVLDTDAVDAADTSRESPATDGTSDVGVEHDAESVDEEPHATDEPERAVD